MHNTTSRIFILAVLGVVSAGAAARADAPAADELSAHRQQMIQWLDEYARNAVYPSDDKGLPVSEFRDPAGRLCPMAYLLHMSGRDDLVNAVVADDNTVRLADVHTGPIEAWIRSSGLTHEEVELVQGAMRLDESRDFHFEDSAILANARGQVNGQLTVIRRVLRRDSDASVAVAKQRVVQGDEAAKLAAGPAVPADVKAKDAEAAKQREQAAARDRVKKH